jgi:asparagine synthase (glutamine-hydrolysing)
MTEVITHRGPDDSGHLLVATKRDHQAAPIEFRSIDELELADQPPPNLGLGFRRLSIIDLSAAGHQPMCNEDASIWIVFNGEFYNSLDYEDELQARGHRFKSTTDTEVILHLYEEHGIGGTLERMNGMFAFALLDLRQRRLFLCRDRVGIKPLYYYSSPRALAFASEVKSLFEYDRVPRSIDGTMAPELLINRYTNTPNTIFSDIRKLAPGTYTEFDFDDPVGRDVQYWSFFDRITGADVTGRDYHEAFVASVSRRLRSDVPVGMFLSGGLDSSTICGVVSQDLRRDLRTFSVEFAGESGWNEGWASQSVAAHLGTKHRRIEFDMPVLESMPEIVWHCEEPIADPALLPTYQLSKITRESVTVSLSGEGSDETNYGYGKYYHPRVGRLIRLLPSAAERLGVAMAAPLLQWLGRGSLNRVARFARDPASEHDREDFMSESAIRGLGIEARYRGRGAWWKKGWRSESVFDVDPYIDFHTRLTDDLLMKIDKMSMAHSLEVRVPFLDHELLELACNIGARAQLRGGLSKAVVREIAGHYVPRSISERRQHGFNVPLVQAFERDLASKRGGLLREYLEAGADLFNPDAVLRSLVRGGRVAHHDSVRLFLLAMTSVTISRFGLSVA